MRKELLDGIFYEKPSPLINHARIIQNIMRIFAGYPSCQGELSFDDKNAPIPDIVVGEADLIVEIISPATVKRDRVYKKELYERYGIKEYWIVDDEKLAVEVYRLVGGKYELRDIFVLLPDYETAGMTEEELALYPTKFETPLFGGLTIDLKDIFNEVYENVHERS